MVNDAKSKSELCNMDCIIKRHIIHKFIFTILVYYSIKYQQSVRGLELHAWCKQAKVTSRTLPGLSLCGLEDCQLKYQKQWLAKNKISK